MMEVREREVEVTLEVEGVMVMVVLVEAVVLDFILEFQVHLQRH
jgi:hypothetical protein